MQIIFSVILDASESLLMNVVKTFLDFHPKFLYHKIKELTNIKNNFNLFLSYVHYMYMYTNIQLYVLEVKNSHNISAKNENLKSR